MTPGQSELRFHCTDDPCGMHMAGQVDDTNRAAFAALLDALADIPDDVTIDARDLRAIDVTAGCLIAQCAAARLGYRTEILADDVVARTLRMLSAEQLTPLKISAPISESGRSEVRGPG
jgi:hypothetical protein